MKNIKNTTRNVLTVVAAMKLLLFPNKEHPKVQMWPELFFNTVSIILHEVDKKQ